MRFVRTEFIYQVRRFDKINKKIPFSQTAELVGAIATGSLGVEQIAQGNVVSGLVELADSAALAGASRSDVRILRSDYEFEHVKLR